MMLLLVLPLLFLVCDAADSTLTVDVSAQHAGTAQPPKEANALPVLEYTMRVTFTNITYNTSLELNFNSGINTTLYVNHAVDPDRRYQNANELRLYSVGPTVIVDLDMHRNDTNTNFSTNVFLTWSSLPIQPTSSLLIPLSPDRPSYISYYGYLGLTNRGSLVVSNPSDEVLCLSRPRFAGADDEMTDTVFVYDGVGIQGAYMGTLASLLGCDRNVPLGHTITLVAPFSVDLTQTPVVYLKSAFSSHSLGSYRPVLLASHDQNASIGDVPMTFVNSDKSTKDLKITLSNFVFADDSAYLKIWCGGVASLTNGEKQTVATMKQSTLSNWTTPEGVLSLACRSVTLVSTLGGGVNVTIDGTVDNSQSLVISPVGPGSRGVFTSFNYPWEETTERHAIRLIKSGKDELNYTLSFPTATHLSMNATSSNANGTKQALSNLSATSVNMTGSDVTLRITGTGVYRVVYEVSAIPTTGGAATLLSILFVLVSILIVY